MNVPTHADIRTALFNILRNDMNVQAFALANDFDLSGSRFREWQPFAPFIDFGVLLDIDPVSDPQRDLSCATKFYDTRFTLYVQYSGAGSTIAGNWLGILETALDGQGVSIDGMSGQRILVKDIEFISRPGQNRREEGWELLSSFHCKATYG